MGHRSSRAAMIYLHARDQRDKAIADGLNTMINELRNGQRQEPKGHAGGTDDDGGHSQDRE